MTPAVTASLSTLAAQAGVGVEAVFGEGGAWDSTAPLHEGGLRGEVTVGVREDAISCVDLGPCKILDGYFPVAGDAVLFDRMHHNGDGRAPRFTDADDPRRLNARQEMRLRKNVPVLPAGPLYFHVGGITSNLWHYFYNFLLRLAVVRQRHGSVERSPYTFLMPAGLKEDFYRFAAILGAPPDRCQLYDASRPVALPNLTVTETPFCLAGGKILASRRACDAVGAPAAAPAAAPGDPRAARIYLSRADAHWRRVLNEDEFVPALEARGFRSVRLTDLTAPGLATLMAGAECVIGPSGANLAATLFCPKGCRVIEFSDRPMIAKYYFQVASTAHGLHHHKLVAEADKAGDDYHRWHVRVPPAALIDLVDGLL